MNSLRAELTGTVVIVRDRMLSSPRDRMFRCVHGLGCHPQMLGRAIHGEFLPGGEPGTINGVEIVGLATEAQRARSLRRAEAPLWRPAKAGTARTGGRR